MLPEIAATAFFFWIFDSRMGTCFLTHTNPACHQSNVIIHYIIITNLKSLKFVVENHLTLK